MLAGEPRLLLDGLRFPEGPRFRDGKLFFSDMYAREVLELRYDGSWRTVVRVPAQPSGLGFLPDGELLVVSMRDPKLLRFDGEALHEHADLSAIATGHCNDMVVDAHGRAYVGNFGFDWEGGEVRQRIELSDRAGFACMLGGPERRTVCLLEAFSAEPAKATAGNGRIRCIDVEVPGAGWP